MTCNFQRKVIFQTLLQELVHHAGVGNGNFERLSGRVSIARLQDAWGMLSEWRLPKRFFLQYTVNSLRDHHLVLGVDFAMMAALSHALKIGQLDLHSLHLEGRLLSHIAGRPLGKTLLGLPQCIAACI